MKSYLFANESILKPFRAGVFDEHRTGMAFDEHQLQHAILYFLLRQDHIHQRSVLGPAKQNDLALQFLHGLELHRLSEVGRDQFPEVAITQQRNLPHLQSRHGGRAFGSDRAGSFHDDQPFELWNNQCFRFRVLGRGRGRSG